MEFWIVENTQNGATARFPNVVEASYFVGKLREFFPASVANAFTIYRGV